jgi:hypothetical protein
LNDVAAWTTLKAVSGVELLQLIETHKASIAWNENYLRERGLLKEWKK